MLFRQLFDKSSSTFTYLIASAKGREALIIDPVLENVEQYIKLLNELNLKLVKVIDTHIHADHISGIAELRDKTNCVTVMGDKTPADVVATTSAGVLSPITVTQFVLSLSSAIPEIWSAWMCVSITFTNFKFSSLRSLMYCSTFSSTGSIISASLPFAEAIR